MSPVTRPGHATRPIPPGLIGPNSRPIYDRVLLGPAGEEKRIFTGVNARAVVAGLTDARLGFAPLGRPGGAEGLIPGISAGGAFAEERRSNRR